MKIGHKIFASALVFGIGVEALAATNAENRAGKIAAVSFEPIGMTFMPVAGLRGSYFVIKT